MANAVRMSFTVPAPLADGLSRVATRLHITRSALLAQLIEEPVAELVKLIEMVPAQPTAGDVKRFRGASRDVINQVVDEALEVANALDPEQKLPL